MKIKNCFPKSFPYEFSHGEIHPNLAKLLRFGSWKEFLEGLEVLEGQQSVWRRKEFKREVYSLKKIIVRMF